MDALPNGHQKGDIILFQDFLNFRDAGLLIINEDEVVVNKKGKEIFKKILTASLLHPEFQSIPDDMTLSIGESPGFPAWYWKGILTSRIIWMEPFIWEQIIKSPIKNGEICFTNSPGGIGKRYFLGLSEKEKEKTSERMEEVLQLLNQSIISDETGEVERSVALQWDSVNPNVFRIPLNSENPIYEL